MLYNARKMSTHGLQCLVAGVLSCGLLLSGLGLSGCTIFNIMRHHQVAYVAKSVILESPHTVQIVDVRSDAPYVLSAIRSARARFYDDRSMHFEGVPLQDYVSRLGLSKMAYVNNIQYDTANEEDAFRRAQETAQHGKIGHFAPDGVSEPDYDGRKAWGENLSWGVNLQGSMQLWIDNEVAALRSSGGFFNSNNGHLYQILNPANISFGYGEATGGPYGCVGALTLSEYAGDFDVDNGKISSNDVTYAPQQQPQSPVPQQSSHGVNAKKEHSHQSKTNGQKSTHIKATKKATQKAIVQKPSKKMEKFLNEKKSARSSHDERVAQQATHAERAQGNNHSILMISAIVAASMIVVGVLWYLIRRVWLKK